MDAVNELYEICETLERELGQVNDKISKAGGKLTGTDVDYVDKLTHAIKSIKTTLAMEEHENGSSQRAYDGYNGTYGSGYNRGGNYSRNRSYSRNRNGRSYAGDSNEVVEDLERIMNNTQNENVRQELSKAIDKIVMG